MLIVNRAMMRVGAFAFAASALAEPGLALAEPTSVSASLLSVISGASKTVTTAQASAPAGGADARASHGAPALAATQDGQSGGDSFVANDMGIQMLLDALSARLRKPIVASPLVQAKRVTGVFDLSEPGALLRRLGATMSLIWYDDGTSIYIYENAEIKNAMVSMQHTTLGVVRDFARETRLDDSRFPIRGDDVSRAFYVSGPPVYVNLIVAAAKYLDRLRGDDDTQRPVVKLVRLHHSFVNDRSYAVRGQPMQVSGIATVLNQIYGDTHASFGSGPAPAEAPLSFGESGGSRRGLGAYLRPASPAEGTASPGAAPSSEFSLLDRLPSARNRADGGARMDGDAGSPGQQLAAPPGVRAIAYPDTNSVILVGGLEQVQDMEHLIRTLDVAKRQIELSLWIIDIKKGELDRLGIVWQARAGRGAFGVNLNASPNLSTLDGGQFLASIEAMSRAGDAQVISRPIVLTQENVPAIFDSSQTLYTQTVGERVAQLDQVTYGMMISVLPRLSDAAKQVEMQVNVEDGNADDTFMGGSASPGGLPLVNRMAIITIARVPVGKSLLIGGNTIDSVSRSEHKIPGLGDIPLLGALFRGRTETRRKVVRVYLIQPRLLTASASWRDGQDWVPGTPEENELLRSTVKLLQPFMGDET